MQFSLLEYLPVGGNFLRGCVHFPVTMENNRNQNDLYRAPTSLVTLVSMWRVTLWTGERHIKTPKDSSCFSVLKLLLIACKVHLSGQEDAIYSLLIHIYINSKDTGVLLFLSVTGLCFLNFQGWVYNLILEL